MEKKWKIKDCYDLENLTWQDIKNNLKDQWLSIEAESEKINNKIGPLATIVEKNLLPDASPSDLLTILPSNNKEFYRIDDIMDQLLIPENKRKSLKHIHWEFAGFNNPKIISATGQEVEGDLAKFLTRDSYKKNLDEKVKQELIAKGIIFDQPFYEQYHTKATNEVINLALYLGVPKDKLNHLRGTFLVYES